MKKKTGKTKYENQLSIIVKEAAKGTKKGISKAIKLSEEQDKQATNKRI